MNIQTTTTVDLSDREVEIFMTALTRARAISNWGENHVKELPESAKPLSEEATKVADTIESFLQWMCVDTDELSWDYDDRDYKEFKEE